MKQEEILAMSERELDRAIAAKMGDKCNGDWWGSLDGSTFRDADGGPRHYSGDAVLDVIEMFKLTVTPKTDATEKSKWLADRELKGNGQLWWGHGPTIGVAVCRAVLMPDADEYKQPGEKAS